MQWELSVHPFMQIILRLILKENTYIHLLNISLLYLQYINDIFMIRKGGENHVKVFLKQLNEQQSAINFDYKIQKEQIAFLGTKLYIDQEKKLQATVYRKKNRSQNLST